MDWYGLGVSIGALEKSRDAARFVVRENVALSEQVGRIAREIEIFERMARQHAIDRGAGEGRSTSAALDNGRRAE